MNTVESICVWKSQKIYIYLLKHQYIPCTNFSRSISSCFSFSGRNAALAALNVWKQMKREMLLNDMLYMTYRKLSDLSNGCLKTVSNRIAEKISEATKRVILKKKTIKTQNKETNKRAAASAAKHVTNHRRAKTCNRWQARKTCNGCKAQRR